MQILAIEFERLAFLGAARHQANRFVLADADVVRARKSAANQQPRARGFDVGVIRRAHRYREIQIAIFENRRPASIPALHHIGDALLADIGDKEIRR